MDVGKFDPKVGTSSDLKVVIICYDLLCVYHILFNFASIPSEEWIFILICLTILPHRALGWPKHHPSTKCLN
jgi:hypothetical protein